MSSIFVTSDTHFRHFRLQDALRGQHTDELIIENWNKVVKNKHDRIYILGDFCMQKSKVIREILPKLKGEIILVGGNHDNIPCAREFIRQGIPTVGCLKLHNLWFTHIPVHPNNLECGIIGNVHGHLHKGGYMQAEDGSRFEYEPQQLTDPRYYNVNVEFHDYKLVPLEEIDAYYKSLDYEPDTSILHTSNDN